MPAEKSENPKGAPDVKLSGSPAERTTAATDVLLGLTAAGSIIWLQWFQPAPSLRIQIQTAGLMLLCQGISEGG
jgi:hypothetical protein